MRPAAKVPYGGKSTAIFGLVLITIFWLGTTQRSAAELSEAYSSEQSKNANLALALDVQTNQLLAGIDNFLLLIKDQYERVAAAHSAAPAGGARVREQVVDYRSSASPTIAVTWWSRSRSSRPPTSSTASSSRPTAKPTWGGC